MTQHRHIHVSPHKQAGVMPDQFDCWHTRDQIVLDCLSLAGPPEPILTGPEVVVRLSVQTRVRLVPAQLPELIEMLKRELDAHRREADGGPGRVRPAA